MITAILVITGLMVLLSFLGCITLIKNKDSGAVAFMFICVLLSIFFGAILGTSKTVPEKEEVESCPEYSLVIYKNGLPIDSLEIR